MPTLCFFPWGTITEALRFGDFHLVSFGEATASGEIPADLVEATVAVLAPYRKRRVDMDSVPLLRQEGRALTADLEDAQIVDYFDFRIRLAFAVLAAREFFTLRYANSDHVRLVVQGFTPAQAGGAGFSCAAVVVGDHVEAAAGEVVGEGAVEALRDGGGGMDQDRGLRRRGWPLR